MSVSDGQLASSSGSVSGCDSSRSGSGRSDSAARVRRSVSRFVSCSLCHSSKQRCSAELPCSRCVRLRRAHLCVKWRDVDDATAAATTTATQRHAIPNSDEQAPARQRTRGCSSTVILPLLPLPLLVPLCLPPPSHPVQPSLFLPASASLCATDALAALILTSICLSALHPWPPTVAPTCSLSSSASTLALATI